MVDLSMNNPFYVNPLGGADLGNIVKTGMQGYDRRQNEELAQGAMGGDNAMLQQLAIQNPDMYNSIMGVKANEQKAAQEQKIAAQQAKSQELIKRAYGGDLNASAELYAINPDLGAKIDGAIGVKDEAQAKQVGGWLEQYLTLAPDKQQQFLEKTADQTPFAVDDKLLEMDVEERSNYAKLLSGRYLNKEQLASLSGVNKDMTTKERDFSTYLKLQKENPANAEKFGRGAGFVAESSPKDLFKVIENESGGMIKVFRDGTQEEMNMGEAVKTDDMLKPMTPKKAQKILSDAKEYQSKAAGFAMRLRDSIDSMNALTKSGKIDAGRVALLNKALGDGSIANVSLSPEEQQYIVEAKDALFAVLRPETGAAITDQELAQYAKIYLPQAGDSASTIATKIKKLENQFDSLRSRSPEIYDASRVIIGEGPSIYEPSNNQEEVQSNKAANTVNWADL